MLSGKNQAGVAPYAYGSLLQAATYGAAVPTIYGCTLSPLLATWAANLQPGGSSKKGKSGKKGVTTYQENITFLLGHNPGLGVLQMWNNGGTIPLAFTSQTFTGPGPWMITDPHFYAVVGVSVAEAYSVTFDDYGSAGPVTDSGTYNVPLWNELMNGPDPVRNSGYRNYPYCYRWQSSYGATVQADAVDIFAGASVTVYYAQLTAATSFQPPLARNRLHFENVLGNGNEYVGNFLNTATPLSTQQILYPMFFGCGSNSIDLGSSGAIPQLQAEVQGKWGLYQSGDGDFADMIEDIFKSGLAQAAIGASSGVAASTPVEHGLSAYSYPGCVQMKCLTGASSSSLGAIAYNMPPTLDNFLVVVATTNGTGGSALSIMSTPSLSWNPVFAGSPASGQVWYATANATGPVSVTVSGQGNSWGTSLIEVSGVDTFDSVSIGLAGDASITTTNAQNFPGYLLSIGLYAGANPVPQPSIPLWNLLTPPNYYGVSPASGYSIQEMPVDSPTSFTLALPTAGLTAQCILAFKCVNPPSYPDPVGDFLDFPSLDLVRIQDRANGLWGSLSMSSQQAASDYLTTLYAAADAAPVFVGFKLFSMPYSEVSIAGNGAIYKAPTAGGPFLNLTTENGDFLASGSTPPIQLDTAERVDQPNVLQMQCLNRTSNYNPSVVSQPDQGSIAIYGIRKQDPVQNNAVQDVAIARKLLSISVKKLQYGGADKYSFEVPQKWCLLAPMGAGGGGNVTATLTPAQMQLMPPVAPGVSVAWSTATASPIIAPVVRSNPFGFSDVFGSAITTLSSGQIGLLNGWPFPPNTIQCYWSNFYLPPSIPKGATILGIYPVAILSNIKRGGFMALSWDVVGGSTGNFGPSGGNPYVGPTSIATTQNETLRTTLTATIQNTTENFGTVQLAMNISFIGLAVYYVGGPGGIPLAFVPDSPNIIDSVLTITDPLADFNEIPVRLTSITEGSPGGSLQCEAEPFIYGMYNPSALTADTPAPFNPSTGQSAGNVNAPIIFQPTSGLQGLNNQGQLWIVVSSPSTSYGGCQVYVSTDGGASYSPLGETLIGSATTGDNTADWPAHATPDTANNLALDLTESAPVGTLQSYSTTTQDGFQYPCYVEFGDPGAAGTNAIASGNISGGSPLGYTGTGALFFSPSFPGLPADAVITAIRPVCSFGTTGAASLTAGCASGVAGSMSPTSGGSNFGSVTGPTGVAQHFGSSIGTSLATLFAAGINVGLSLSSSGAASSSFTATNIAWGIIYTSATPSIDPTISNPFSIPGGSGLAWAIPLGVTPGISGSSGFGNTATASGEAGSPSWSGGYGYELMTYGVATLTATNKYTLQATGSGNHLDRGVYGAPATGVGVDHPTGSRFAFLNPNSQGILKVPLPAQWIGQLLYFKICSFNTFGQAAQSLSAVVAYPFMPLPAPAGSGGAGGAQLFLVNGM